MAVQKVQVTLSDRKVLSKEFIHTFLTLDQPALFEPGQYINIQCEGLFRAYSLVSLPRDNNTIELCIDIKPGGPGSRFAEQAQLGTQVMGLFPLGMFNVVDKERPAYFIATGSGIAPFKAMIEHLLQTQKEPKPVWLVWGMKYKGELFWMEEWESLHQKYPHFNYWFCLSREENKDFSQQNVWYGRVTDYLEQQGELSAWQAYICGSDAMVKQVKGLLLQKSMVESNIHFEKFH